MCIAKTDQPDRRQFKILDEYSKEKGLRDIAQEVIDSLIAVRASYEPTCRGAIDVLGRNYDLNTSQYNLLHHRDQDFSISSTCGRFDRQQTFVIVRSSNGGIFIACRGTFDLSDVVQDVKVAKAPVPFTSTGRAQVGFLERALCFPLQLFLSLLRAGEKLIFTGHSMGGAVSSLLAIRVLEALASVPGHAKISRERVKCITFGSAPFADLELADYVNCRYRDFFYNLVSKHDLVPRAHNLIPKIVFPVAKKVVDAINGRWEAQVTCRLIEAIAGMPMGKTVLRLEDRFSFLWPATWMFRLILDCAAANEKSLCFGHCGYLLLLDPEAREARKVVCVDRMETLNQDFCMGSKSASELLREHGLANYYECLVHTLSSTDEVWACKVAIRQSSGGNTLTSRTLSPGLSLRDFLVNPSQSCEIHLSRIMLRGTGNDFEASGDPHFHS